MARSKVKCKGKTQDGTPCKNWALEGSYYCQLHQGQETAQDRQNMQSAQSNATIILWLIVIVGFLMSLAFGCERGFIDWLGR
jgi:hypothetical protein